ncbi:tetratricopeptide repeat protein, partial [Prochlorococcus marinus]
GILRELGNLQEAELSLRKAIELNPNFAIAHSNLGGILINLGKLHEAELSFRKAIEINPDFAEVHSNLGMILKNLGKLHEAELSTRKAIEINPDLVEAKLNLNLIAMTRVPRWHIPMINDRGRNDTYFKAIKLAIKENNYVLEIGTGSGLLSMMAVDEGANKVITCEINESISEIAKKIISKNGYQEKITVLNKKSTELKVGKDLYKKADVIISEIFSSEFVGEGIQSSILDAKERLLKEGGTMIPEAGDIKIALLKRNSKIEDLCITGKYSKFDLSDFSQITGNKFNNKVNHLNVSYLSKDTIAFSFNFYSNKIIKRQEKIIEVPVSENGICIGIITWIKVNLYRNIYYENNPSIENESHWSTPIYTFKKPLKVSKGDIIKIKATLLEDQVWFELIN